jgi:hypothetical protein
MVIGRVYTGRSACVHPRPGITPASSSGLRTVVPLSAHVRVLAPLLIAILVAVDAGAQIGVAGEGRYGDPLTEPAVP